MAWNNYFVCLTKHCFLITENIGLAFDLKHFFQFLNILKVRIAKIKSEIWESEKTLFLRVRFTDFCFEIGNSQIFIMVSKRRKRESTTNFFHYPINISDLAI